MTVSRSRLAMDAADRPERTLPDLMLTRQEVAVVLRLGLSKTSELIRSGELPSVRVCGLVRVRVSDLRIYVEALPVEREADDDTGDDEPPAEDGGEPPPRRRLPQARAGTEPTD